MSEIVTAQPSADWRTLPAGRELDRVIAEKLRYHVIALDKPRMYALVDPNAQRIGGYSLRHNAVVADSCATTEADAWIHAFKPRWSIIADDALKLLSELHITLSWELRQQPINRLFVCQIADWTSPDYHDAILACERADTAALAICRAWLALMERQHER